MSRREDPVEDEVGAFARGISQHPADGLADEELLLLEHRIGEAREPVEVPASLPQRNQVRQQCRAANPKVVIERPAFENRIEAEILFGQRADEIPGQRVDESPGFRLAKQALDEVGIPSAEAVLRLDEHHCGRGASLVDGCGVPCWPGACVRWFSVAGRVVRRRRRGPEGSGEIDDLIVAELRCAQSGANDGTSIGHAHPVMEEFALEVGLLLLGAFAAATGAQISVDRLGEGLDVVPGIGGHGTNHSTVAPHRTASCGRGRCSSR